MSHSCHLLWTHPMCCMFFLCVFRVELDPHVRDCVQSYIQPWLVVSRRYISRDFQSNQKSITVKEMFSHSFFFLSCFMHRTQEYGWISYSERTDTTKVLQRQIFESEVQPDKQEQPVSTLYSSFL